MLRRVLAETPHTLTTSSTEGFAMYAPAEKNLAVLRRVLAETPGATLAFVGDGPERAMLEEHLAGLPVTFMVRCCGSAGLGVWVRDCDATSSQQFCGLGKTASAAEIVCSVYIFWGDCDGDQLCADPAPI